jgi:phosphatidylinositol glycan class S
VSDPVLLLNIFLIHQYSASSVSDDPVIHFLAFIPSVDRRPLRLLDSGGEVTPYNSFILPQWGGIIIVNPEEPHVDDESSSQSDMVFATFQNQLLSLLGVHPLPRGVSNLDKQQVISDWQLDSLMRRRLLETSQSAQDTLSSIVKLVHQIENMPVGSDVRNDVQDALFALDKVSNTILIGCITSHPS